MLAALDAYHNPDGGYAWRLEPDLRSAESQPAAAMHAEVLAEAAPSLQMTAQVAANTHLLGRHQPNVAVHRWLAMATEYCLEAIRGIDGAPHAYELLFALKFLDAVAERVPDTRILLERLGRYLPAGGSMRVEGGAEDELLHPLDFAPHPDRPVRSLFPADVIAADLERLARLQQSDVGWLVDFMSYSPAVALEWRGYPTVQAVGILQSNAH